MGKILKITEKLPKEAILPDGLYLGIWGGSIIEVSYKNKEYQLETEEGVRGIGYKVLVKIEKGIATFEEINN